MKQRPAGTQRGAALLALLLVLALGAAWYLTSRLDALGSNLTAINRNQNAAVLAQAKLALLGYVANEAAQPGENDPGAFPCPEAVGNIGGANEGVAAGNCTLPAVGRFPWKTLGTDQLRDASGEPLWYVVANGWAKPNAGTNTIINSNCSSDSTAWTSPMTCWSGQLTVDGQAQGAVALIIAPGPAMNVAAAAGCAARNQARSAPSPTINYLDYIECSDTATATFVTTASSASFNDQVVKVTAAEAQPLIEAAIADRFRRELAPQIRAAYTTGLWPAAPVLPFAVPFGNPTTNPANKFQGSAATLQGLLPASYSFAATGCTCDAPNTTPCVCSVNSQGQRSLEPCVAATDPRCDPGFVTWRTAAPCGAGFCTSATVTAGAMTIESVSCTVAGAPSTLNCDISASTNLFNALLGNTSMTLNLDAVASNVGMTVRQVNSISAASRAPQITGIDTTYANTPIGYNITSATMNSDGSATVRINSRFAAGSGSILAVLGALTCDILGIPLCYQYTLSVPIGVIADHPVIHPTTTTYNWFFRNRWPEVAYYAVAPGIAPSGARSCTDSTTCLQTTYHPTSGKHRALLVFGGAKLTGQVRPAVAVTDLLEGVNAAADVNNPTTLPFALRSPPLAVNRTFNDHVGVIDSNP